MRSDKESPQIFLEPRERNLQLIEAVFQVRLAFSVKQAAPRLVLSTTVRIRIRVIFSILSPSLKSKYKMEVYRIVADTRNLITSKTLSSSTE